MHTVIKEWKISSNQGVHIHTLPLASSRESTGSTTALLEVEAPAATPDTKGVGLVPPLTKTPCSLTLQFSSFLQISSQ